MSIVFISARNMNRNWGRRIRTEITNQRFDFICSGWLYHQALKLASSDWKAKNARGDPWKTHQENPRQTKEQKWGSTSRLTNRKKKEKDEQRIVTSPDTENRRSRTNSRKSSEYFWENKRGDETKNQKNGRRKYNGFALKEEILKFKN